MTVAGAWERGQRQRPRTARSQGQ